MTIGVSIVHFVINVPKLVQMIDILLQYRLIKSIVNHWSLIFLILNIQLSIKKKILLEVVLRLFCFSVSIFKHLQSSYQLLINVAMQISHFNWVLIMALSCEPVLKILRVQRTVITTQINNYSRDCVTEPVLLISKDNYQN